MDGSRWERERRWEIEVRDIRGTDKKQWSRHHRDGLPDARGGLAASLSCCFSIAARSQRLRENERPIAACHEEERRLFESIKSNATRHSSLLLTLSLSGKHWIYHSRHMEEQSQLNYVLEDTYVWWLHTRNSLLGCCGAPDAHQGVTTWLLWCSSWLLGDQSSY